MSTKQSELDELILFIKEQCIDTSDPGLVWFDFDKAEQALTTYLHHEQLRLIERVYENAKYAEDTTAKEVLERLELVIATLKNELKEGEK